MFRGRLCQEASSLEHLRILRTLTFLRQRIRPKAPPDNFSEFACRELQKYSAHTSLLTTSHTTASTVLNTCGNDLLGLMEIKDMLALVEDLEDDVENLKTSLEPLLTTPLSEITKKLPLLDRAKAYVIAVYAIESLLFCTHLRYSCLHISDYSQLIFA